MRSIHILILFAALAVLAVSVALPCVAPGGSANSASPVRCC